MPEIAFCVLMGLLEFEEASEFQISVASGYSPKGNQSSGLYRTLRALVRMEFVRRPWAGKWAITERGKIALAIEVGRRTKQRHAGKVVKRYGWRKRFETWNQASAG